ncbi:MAG: hypothetical protein ACRYFR_19885 [Janthinobacterium lividum]
MQSKATVSFTRRGLTGLLLMAAELTLALVFKQRSSWPAEVKQLAYPLALVLGVGGSQLLGSYVRQRPLGAMKKELLATVLIVAVLALGRLVG